MKQTDRMPQSQSSSAADVPDRAAIAHAVEHVMAHLGIARGAAASGAAKPSAASASVPDSSSRKTCRVWRECFSVRH